MACKVCTWNTMACKVCTWNTMAYTQQTYGKKPFMYADSEQCFIVSGIIQQNTHRDVSHLWSRTLYSPPQQSRVMEEISILPVYRVLWDWFHDLCVCVCVCVHVNASNRHRCWKTNIQTIALFLYRFLHAWRTRRKAGNTSVFVSQGMALTSPQVSYFNSIQKTLYVIIPHYWAHTVDLFPQSNCGLSRFERIELPWNFLTGFNQCVILWFKQAPNLSFPSNLLGSLSLTEGTKSRR